MQRFEDIVLYEDNHLLIINKPSGWLSQGDKTGDRTAVEFAMTYIKEKYNKPGKVFLHPVHRLDRPASGALILSRTTKGLQRMNEVFKSNKIEKIYHMVTSGKILNEDGVLINYLIKDAKNNYVKCLDKSAPNAKKAILSYKVLMDMDKKTLIEVRLETGRSHQIRTQMAHIGLPIVGDTKYGSPIQIDDQSIALHSFSMQFVHPIKLEALAIQAPYPKKAVWKTFG